MTDEIDTNAPERIWAVFEQHESNRGHPVVFASAKKTKGQEYVRADLYDAERQRAEKAEAEVERLREALKDMQDLCARSAACGAIARAALRQDEGGK